jgi:very-short-patch-repair endonuclease
MPHDSGVRSRPGLSVRHRETRSSETVNIRGLKATALQRTLRDLCHHWLAAEALVAIDMALHLGLTDAESLGRARGHRLRKLAAMAAPAESPMETRLRWLLLEAGLPRPEVQTNLHNSDGRFVGRADLYYPGARLVIEYDGGNHRDRLVEDNRRQNLMVNAGFRLLRFTAADIRNRPDVVSAQVRGAL